MLLSQAPSELRALIQEKNVQAIVDLLLDLTQGHYENQSTGGLFAENYREIHKGQTVVHPALRQARRANRLATVGPFALSFDGRGGARSRSFPVASGQAAISIR
jgi:hypothetical protein